MSQNSIRKKIKNEILKENVLYFFCNARKFQYILFIIHCKTSKFESSKRQILKKSPKFYDKIIILCSNEAHFENKIPIALIILKCLNDNFLIESSQIQL